MKKLMLLFLCFLSLSAFSQKIKVNEVDKFTKKKVIETSFEKIVNDNNPMMATGGRMMKNVWVGFKKVDDVIFMRLKWCTNKIMSVTDGAEIILLDSDGNSYPFKNLKPVISETGAGTVGFAGSAIPGLDIYVTGDFSQLVDKLITSLRIYTTDGYVDFELSKKETAMISDSYKIIKDL